MCLSITCTMQQPQHIQRRETQSDTIECTGIRADSRAQMMLVCIFITCTTQQADCTGRYSHIPYDAV
jgi:hypothetical protein